MKRLYPDTPHHTNIVFQSGLSLVVSPKIDDKLFPFLPTFAAPVSEWIWREI